MSGFCLAVVWCDATTNYYGYVKNISVNNPVGGEMVGASALFAGQMASYLEQAGQLTAAAEQAAAAGNQDLAQQYAELAQKAVRLPNKWVLWLWLRKT